MHICSSDWPDETDTLGCVIPKLVYPVQCSHKIAVFTFLLLSVHLYLFSTNVCVCYCDKCALAMITDGTCKLFRVHPIFSAFCVSFGQATGILYVHFKLLWIVFMHMRTPYIYL